MTKMESEMQSTIEISRQKESIESEDLQKLLFERLDRLDGKKDGKICKGNVLPFQVKNLDWSILERIYWFMAFISDSFAMAWLRTEVEGEARITKVRNPEFFLCLGVGFQPVTPFRFLVWW